MRAVDPAARISFEPKSNWPGLETPPVSDVVGLAKTLADRNEHSKVAYGTEAGLYALAGIDEYIAVAQLEACSTFLDRLIAHSRG